MSSKDQDKIIRRNWLITYLCSLGLNLIALFTSVPISEEDGYFIFLACFLVPFFVVGYALYHCAYRKQGTKFLTLMIIFGLMNILHMLNALCREPTRMSLVIYLTNVALSCIVLKAHFQLLKVNKRVRAEVRQGT